MVGPRTSGCIAMGRAVLFILRSRLLLIFMYVWLYVYLGFTRACVFKCDGDVICVGHDLNRCSWWWYVCSVNVG